MAALWNVSGQFILEQAIKDWVGIDFMHQLRCKLATAAETVIWLRGFNIMRESIGLLKVDWRIGAKVSLSSLRRFI